MTCLIISSERMSVRRLQKNEAPHNLFRKKSIVSKELMIPGILRQETSLPHYFFSTCEPMFWKK
jgi:hypothetical protein